jgi:hypothetical protein
LQGDEAVVVRRSNAVLNALSGEHLPQSGFDRGGGMSRIERVEVHGFAFEVEGLGLPEHGAAGVGNWVYCPGSRVKASRYAVRILTDDGLAGEYVTHWVGTPAAMAQTLMLAPHLIGRDPEAREQIYDDLKRELRAYDHMGHGPIDIALWTSPARSTAPRSRSCSAASARAFAPTPAPTTARRRRAGSTAPRRSRPSRGTAARSATPASRSTAGTTAMPGARRATCRASAPRSATTWRS